MTRWVPEMRKTSERFEVAQREAPLACPKRLGGDQKDADGGAADEIEVIEVQGQPRGALAEMAHHLPLEVGGRGRVQTAAGREDERLVVSIDIDADRVGHQERLP